MLHQAMADTVYVVGDFTASLDAAFSDVRAVVNNKNIEGYLRKFVNEGSIVFQGHNSLYSLGWNNRLQQTISDFGKGTMADGTSASTYLNDCNYGYT